MLSVFLFVQSEVMIKALVTICICLYKTYVFSLFERGSHLIHCFSLVPGGQGKDKLRVRDLTVQRKLQNELIFFLHFEFLTGYFS